jgi:SGNH domain (fused to AT3 domains)
MQGRRTRAARTALLLAVGLLALATTANAAIVTPRASTPGPGSAVEIAELVHAAPSITQVPAQSYPSIYAEASDSASREYPATDLGCHSINECVFGDTTSSQTIVLFGDSHAQMWLSAVVPAAAALHYRVVLLYLGGCPAATVTVWNPLPLLGSPAGDYTVCNHFRSAAITAIDRLHPGLVLLSNRTAMVESGNGTYFTDAQWKAGVRTTIEGLKRSNAKVAVIGDIVYLNQPMPQCIAANHSNVQACASPNPNPTAHSHEAAERAETLSLGARFINPLSWICTTTCSPVIGSFLAYLNNAHLDATYVTFLSTVMQSALEKVLAP